VTRDGHYLVTGGIPLLELTIGIDSAGDSVDWRAGKQYPLQMSYALCRCGRSGNKPFCDGSHMGR
jgi:CDGSH-type Zn-finger protein